MLNLHEIDATSFGVLLTFKTVEICFNVVNADVRKLCADIHVVVF